MHLFFYFPQTHVLITNYYNYHLKYSLLFIIISIIKLLDIFYIDILLVLYFI